MFFGEIISNAMICCKWSKTSINEDPVALNFYITFTCNSLYNFKNKGKLKKKSS